MKAAGEQRMLGEFRHRRQRRLVEFLGLAMLLVFALRGFAAAAPVAALVDARANGQSAICVGSAIIAISEDGRTRHIAFDTCDDCLTNSAAPPPQAGAVVPPSSTGLAAWRVGALRAAPLRASRAHPARAPPLA